MDQRFYKTADGQSGLFFTALGAFVVWQASTYSIGTVAKMGPGYFPLVLGILLTIVGLAVTFKSIRTSQRSGRPVRMAERHRHHGGDRSLRACCF